MECFGHVPPGACWGIHLPGNSPSKSNDASLPLEFGRKITTSRNTFPIPEVLVFWFQFRLCSSLLGAEKRAKQQTRQDRKAHLERARAHRVLLVVMLASVRVFMFLIMRPVCGARKATLKATIMSLLGNGEGAERSTKEWFVWLSRNTAGYASALCSLNNFLWVGEWCDECERAPSIMQIITIITPWSLM